jgi:hypothetical protein
MSTLYIFATSERPDAYINTLAYSIDHLQAEAIYIIVISEHDYAEEARADELLASTVLSNINEQLHALSQGLYISSWKAQGERKSEHLMNRSGLDIYKRCLEAMNKSGTTGIIIPLSNLDRTLKTYVSKGGCIIDVSALKKNLLVDVVATLLSIGSSDVFSFELKKRQSYGQEDLYHSLRVNEDYIFRNLANSESVRKSLRRISKWSARAKAILLFTLLLTAIFTPLAFFWKGSSLLAFLNIAAMAASIGSYLFLFVRERS